MQKLLCQQTRNSTTQMYLRIWRQFNTFIIRLDKMPKLWEDRVMLFITYKIDNSLQSASVRSYVSAIKRILIDDGYQWDDTKILLGSLTKVCRIVNDRVRCRLPIQCGLLDLILFKVRRMFAENNQFYLQVLYSRNIYLQMTSKERTNCGSSVTTGLRKPSVHVLRKSRMREHIS